MAQRKSGYAKRPNEFFPSPPWIIDALAEHVKIDGLSVWEPAAGGGDMARALVACGASVRETDLIPEERPRSFDRAASVDFLSARQPVESGIEAIITNPPFSLGTQFIAKGLEFLRGKTAVRLVAFLFAVDFDSAKGRTALFADCEEFAMKIALLRRIKWFEGPSGPSTNHAWFVWQRLDSTRPHGPVLRWAPRTTDHVDLGDL